MPTWRVEGMIGLRWLARDRILDSHRNFEGAMFDFASGFQPPPILGRIGIIPSAYSRSIWSRGKDYDCIVLRT